MYSKRTLTFMFPVLYSPYETVYFLGFFTSWIRIRIQQAYLYADPCGSGSKIQQDIRVWRILKQLQRFFVCQLKIFLLFHPPECGGYSSTSGGVSYVILTFCCCFTRPSVADIQVPLEVFDYIDGGRNPQLYTKVGCLFYCC